MFRDVTTLLRLLPKAAFLSVLYFSGAAGAEAGQLSGWELRQLFPGQFQVLVQGAFRVSITARRDGSLTAVFMSKSDSGHWSIRSGKLCIRLSKWHQGRTSCSVVVEEEGWYRASDVLFKEADGMALAERSTSR